MEEKRRFGRIPFGSSVTLDVDNQSCPAQLLDLSLKGARVSLPDGADLQIGDSCRFHLRLTDSLRLEFRALVVYQEGAGVGLKFMEAEPESFSHLLRLMELNTGDGDQIEREVSRLGG